MATFNDTLATHITALLNRDLDTFVATLSRRNELSVILPNGMRVNGFDRVVELHSAWFADPDWSMELEPLHTIENDGMALALFSVTYDDADQSGNPYRLHYYLTLVFEHSGDQWLLIHDQNTITTV